MATLYTHAALGLGIAQLYMPPRKRPLYCMLALLLAILPDIDVFSNAAYGSLRGHRGITHSIGFAVVAGIVSACLAHRWLRGSYWAVAGVFFLSTASHGLLDAMTRGGESIPFFWPASDQKYGNWGPIPVSDVGAGLPNPWRSRALRAELLWVWLPAAVWAGGISAYRRGLTRFALGKEEEET